MQGDENNMGFDSDPKAWIERFETRIGDESLHRRFERVWRKLKLDLVLASNHALVCPLSANRIW